MSQPHHHEHHDLGAGAHDHGGRRMPVTDDEWHEHYVAEAIWSGNPNGALVAEVSGLVPGRAVDVGCGEGADAVWLASQGWQVTGFDVAGSALDRGRAAAVAAGVEVEWLRAGLLSAELPQGAFDLVSACYPALLRTPEGLAEQALLALVAPGGRLLVLAHADIDREQAIERGFDPDDYVDLDAIRAALPNDWTIETDDRRDRHVATGAGAGHTTDLVLLARRPDPTR
jgi:SAM-dependent methyltransferase